MNYKLFSKRQYYFLINFGKFKIYLTTHALRKRKHAMKNGSWRKMARDKKLDEQNGQCKLCGKAIRDSTASLHHIKPVSLYPGLAKDLNNVVLLCHACHRAVHEKANESANLSFTHPEIFNN